MIHSDKEAAGVFKSPAILSDIKSFPHTSHFKGLCIFMFAYSVIGKVTFVKTCDSALF